MDNRKGVINLFGNNADRIVLLYYVHALPLPLAKQNMGIYKNALAVIDRGVLHNQKWGIVAILLTCESLRSTGSCP